MFNLFDRPIGALFALLKAMGEPYYLNPTGVKGPPVADQVRTHFLPLYIISWSRACVKWD